MTNLERNSLGLYENVKYIFNDDGTVNWRKMIPKEYLVPNEDRLDDEQKKLLSEKQLDIETLQDNQMLILLGGIKYLAKLRGYSSVSFKLVTATREYCCSICSISWIPNFETEGRITDFESVADAHLGNTDEAMGGNYLASIAENRSFVRCVRNFLGINIVGQEEIKTSKNKTYSKDTYKAPQPKDILEKLMVEHDISFDKIKTKLISLGVTEAESYSGLENLSISQALELAALIKKSKKIPK